MYPITIDYAYNGLIVRAGCKTFVFEDINTFMVVLNKYLKDPEHTEIDMLANSMWPVPQPTIGRPGQELRQYPDQQLQWTTIPNVTGSALPIAPTASYGSDGSNLAGRGENLVGGA